MKIKKTAKIEIRIDEDLKEKFIHYAKNHNQTVSDILRKYIEECIFHGKKN